MVKLSGSRATVNLHLLMRVVAIAMHYRVHHRTPARTYRFCPDPLPQIPIPEPGRAPPVPRGLRSPVSNRRPVLDSLRSSANVIAHRSAARANRIVKVEYRGAESQLPPDTFDANDCKIPSSNPIIRPLSGGALQFKFYLRPPFRIPVIWPPRFPPGASGPTPAFLDRASLPCPRGPANANR